MDPDAAKNWDQDEVIERWRMLFSGGVLIERYLAGQCGTDAELDKVAETAEIWRRCLMDISWLMRCLNENIARQANKEDKCKGRFWEGRFKSQALLDERALLACMAYVDLNTIRAGSTDTPETSDFTSIQQRLRDYQQEIAATRTPSSPESNAIENTQKSPKSVPLSTVAGGFNDRKGIPFDEKDYLELVDWTGRAVHPEKKGGSIPESLPSLLSRLGIASNHWIESITGYDKHFGDVVGHEAKMKESGQSRGVKWLRGVRACRRLLAISNETGEASRANLLMG